MTGCQQLRIHEDVGCLNSFGLQTFTLFLYCATQEPFSPRQSSASVNASDHESDMLEEQPWKKTVSVITEWCQVRFRRLWILLFVTGTNQVSIHRFFVPHFQY
ncbi:hypothetical protein CRM22_007358 [Opisthorchis felineus]|uniref:Uncharacterized protein n=1 Tax=Opisthorchis felineus TaxID=147828 RepID=A0A4S2LPJ7_OPIFE|nr:hypothetical protein CRM22_007358 [Opisthorchis felineus]